MAGLGVKRLIAAAIVVVALLVPAVAAGHIERASYWPLPAADTSVSPPAGGSVPTPGALADVLVPATAQVKIVPATAQVKICKPVPKHAKRKHAKRHTQARQRKRHLRARHVKRHASTPCGVTRKKHKRMAKHKGTAAKRGAKGKHKAKHKAKHKQKGRQKARLPTTVTTPTTTVTTPTEETLAPGARVVCQPDSLTRATQSIANAQTQGFRARPTAPIERLDATQARDLLELNQDLFALCQYNEIQPAVTASTNNGRVVIMPGLYPEPTARKAQTHDPACAHYTAVNDKNQISAVSYAYQLHCPNDANLIAVIGRGLGTGTDPSPPLTDRHGIPNRGPCIRCNLQIEGSGPSADDVVIDAGRVASGNSGPIGPVKDVGIRVDRADGFVLRGVTVRHAAEHDIYVLETSGYLLDRFKTFYGGEYGVLTFVEDFGLVQNCEAAGNGDSGLYPGAGAKTGDDRDTSVYPTFRYSQEIRFCDSHHNAGGYSGTDGSATHIDHNNFYDNALGFTTDVFTAPGHPGFPQASDLVENNNFYSNNFNPYLAGSDVKPTVPVPVGTGLWIAGGNSNIVRNNHFFDNWRRGTMLFAVPDQAVCGPAGQPVTGCDPAKFSTSYNNRFSGNVMGVAPDGSVQPNGTDFWWDSYPGNTGNCWFSNVPAPGKNITTSPILLPDCAGGSAPSSSVGTGSLNESELGGCLVGFAGGGYNPATCPWFTTPSKPPPS